jgi:hypothetical protein
MHHIAVALLVVLAGTLLLAKSKKEELGKFFISISWFFLVVGFLLFIGSIAGGICKMKHHCMSGESGCQKEIMIKEFHGGMNNSSCCPADMCKKHCEGKECCMKHDSIIKSCPDHMKMEGDSGKMCCPKAKQKGKP